MAKKIIVSGKNKNYINSLLILNRQRGINYSTLTSKRRGNDLTDNDIENPESGFLARNLNDTAYASKFIKNFVERNLAFLENSEIKQK
ncbi:hypothetical protein BSPWISOXPB_3654 [uncultured Gammaproteobacteria bacterium]|nr:hypothetical protein BSPWISOXPB_3654 [uncultured Gammaproteobacteria bacterium]